MESKELEKLVREIKDSVKDSGGSKLPTATFKFMKTDFTNIFAACKGYDGNFYLFNGDLTLQKYENLANPGVVPSDSGFSWDISVYGEVRYIDYLPEGFVVFTNYTLGEYDKARIYHMETINSTPELVYESESNGADDYWAGGNAFGIKTYYNGVTSYVLAGVYGRGQNEKDLLLSKDGGKSFSVIKKTINADASGVYNSHWHDVAFDVYHGIIWASEGDDTINQHVYYSNDLGSTWKTASSDIQPTTIIPFPTRVIFGRDSNIPGLDYLDKPTTLSGYNDISTSPLYEFKTNTLSYKYYAKSPLSEANEGYMAFELFPDEQPRIILGTGDFGKSWHSLFIGETEGDGKVSGLFAMDNEYIYAYGGSNNRSIFVTKRPLWV